MTDKSLIELVQALTKKLASQTEPIAPKNLINTVRQEYPQFSAADIRRAIWHLESRSELDFEPEWKIRRTRVA